MKKNIFAIFAMLMTLCALLVSCKAKEECDFCNEIKHCDTTTILGEEYYICDDCRKELDQLFE